MKFYKILITDLFVIFGTIGISLYIFLQIVKGLNYYDSLSMEWWIIITLILLMVRSDFFGLYELKRLKKYSKLMKKYSKLIKH